jgi:hypothetical protein
LKNCKRPAKNHCRCYRKKAEKTPQVWALYKEVQDYYDKGMRVPDDVILLFCDDNWGNVRKLPDFQNLCIKAAMECITTSIM